MRNYNEEFKRWLEFDGLTDEELDFEVTATDYGSLSCSVEEFRDDGTAVGRMNFFNIPLEPEQELSLAVPETIPTSTGELSIKSNNEEIFANEYISSDDSGGVEISCLIEADDGQAGGMVYGTDRYVRGDAVVLMAIPDDGYTFRGWFHEDELITTSSVYEFMAKEDLYLEARFAAEPEMSLELKQDGNQVYCLFNHLETGAVLSLAFYTEDLQMCHLTQRYTDNGICIVDIPDDAASVAVILLSDDCIPLTEKISMQFN